MCPQLYSFKLFMKADFTCFHNFAKNQVQLVLLFVEQAELCFVYSCVFMVSFVALLWGVCFSVIRLDIHE